MRSRNPTSEKRPHPPVASGRRPATILVTDASRGSALAIIRSLGRSGYRVLAADCDPRSPGFRSRWATERLLCPSPVETPQRFADWVLQLVRDRSIDLVIPVTDAAIFPLAALRLEFAGLTQLAIAETHALTVAASKQQTLELAASCQVPLPKTIVVHSAMQGIEQANALGWPVVLKPITSWALRTNFPSEKLQVRYADSRTSLAEQLAEWRRFPLLLQEYYPGVAEGVELLVDRGRPLYAFQHRRVREVPVTGGPSAMRMGVQLDPELFEYSRRLLGELQWTGLAMVEFKRGADGPKLMEINGRVWGSLPLAVQSGMDFPARLAELYLPASSSRAVRPDQSLSTAYTIGKRVRNLELDLMWIVAVLRGKRRYGFLPIPRRREAVRALAELFDPRCRCDVESWSDPRPALAQLRRSALKFLGKLAGRPSQRQAPREEYSCPNEPYPSTLGCIEPACPPSITSPRG